MTPEKENRIIKDFPLIWKKDPVIDCGDGWFNLIYTLCNSIQNRIAYHTGPIDIQLNVIKCDQKFGGLRFYFQGGDDMIRGMIFFAENLSVSICERCGAPGKTVTDTQGQIETLCENHKDQ